MHLAILFFTTALTLTFLVLALAWALAYRSLRDREKLSPYECGFDPCRSARTPFSLRFFLLAVIFLVFDIEIILLIALPLLLLPYPALPIFLGVTLFLLILIFGLIHEWNEGSLEWAL